MLLMVAVVIAGATAMAAGRAGSTVTARQRAGTVAESVVAGVAADRVRGLDAATAIARGRDLAARNSASVLGIVEVDGRIEVRIVRAGALGTARARLEW